MSQFIVNLALLIFIFGIIVTGIQILALSENQKLIQQKKDKFIKMCRVGQIRLQPLFQRLLRPLAATLKTTVLAEPTKTEKKLTEELKQSFSSSKSFFQGTLDNLFGIFLNILAPAFLTVMLVSIIYILMKHGVEGIIDIPKNFIEAVETFASRVTTPLIEPFIKRYLE